jgi:plastocyanin
MVRLSLLPRIVAALLLMVCSTSSIAATLSAAVFDSDGAPVADAVIFIVNGNAPPAPAPATMVQRDQSFAPHVLAVSVGTTVEFPNEDPFRHHVYSFSPAKRFELKLYGGDDVQQVVFDTPGEIALGCNIHDDMLGYIYVVDSAHFAVTGADGTAIIDGLADNETYEAQVWHPRLRGPTRRTSQDVNASAPARFEIGLKRDRRGQDGSEFEEGVY